MRRVRAVVAAAMLIALLLRCGARKDLDCSKGGFSSARWLATSRQVLSAHPEEAIRERRQMADYLVACKTLTGQTKVAVRRLLGKPLRPDGSGSWDYYVGPERGLALDDETLNIKFNAGRVRQIRISPG